MAASGEDFFKARLEKDLAELKKMIDNHFVQRKKDEDEIQSLEKRIDERKTLREQQMAERAAREAARVEKEKQEKEKKLEEEKRKAEEEAQKKKEAMAKMAGMHGLKNTQHQSGQNRQRKGRATERDRKKKLLAERRKPLNIDHMDIDKLRTKCQDLWDYLKQLETERYDFDKRCVDQKYEVNLLRFRSNMLAGQSSKDKAKRIGRLMKK